MIFDIGQKQSLTYSNTAASTYLCESSFLVLVQNHYHELVDEYLLFEP
jgi:hypothetical protein